MGDIISHSARKQRIVVKLKLEKNSGLNGIRVHELCDTGAVLYQLTYQANWELAALSVRNIPVDGEEYKEYK